MKENCIFCKIVNKEIKSKILYEDDDFIVINDINPVAPIHLLIITKKHYENILQLDNNLNFLKPIKAIAKKLNLKEFRVINNCGISAGQSVFHIHFHILSGRKFTWPPG